jgi:hypothetical protein
MNKVFKVGDYVTVNNSLDTTVYKIAVIDYSNYNLIPERRIHLHDGRPFFHWQVTLYDITELEKVLYGYD